MTLHLDKKPLEQDLTVVDLKKLAYRMRRQIIDMAVSAGGGHIAPALSAVEILISLYFRVLRINPEDPQWPERDRFILSKGHGCCALYAVLAERGFLHRDALKTFCQDGHAMGGHPEYGKIPGVETSTGSLGHGLSIAIGISLAAKNDGNTCRSFVLLGDGECNEGSVWEAAMAASQFQLDNLVAIIDYNKLLATGFIKDVMALEPFAMKWKAFGWEVREVNGHDINEVSRTLNEVPFAEKRPSVVIAHTVKGKGVSYMENNPVWHYRLPNKEELLQAYKELNEGLQSLT